jgi:hypothetical protein
MSYTESLNKVNINKYSLLKALCMDRSEHVRCNDCYTGYFSEWTDEREMQCDTCRRTVDVKSFLRGHTKQHIVDMAKEAMRKISLAKLGTINTKW